MRKNPVVSIVLALSLVSGCAKSAEGQHPDPAMLSGALLTITDMPGQWRETQRQAFSKREAENPSVDPSIWCPGAGNVTKNLVSLAGDAGADVEMQDLSAGNRYRLMRLQAWSNDNVDAYFADAKEAVHICDGKTTTDASGATTANSIIDNRDIGDESISWEERITPPPSTRKQKMESLGRTTIARFGGIIMVLQMGDGGMTGTASLMDEDAWWAVVEKAGKRLADLDRQVHD